MSEHPEIAFSYGDKLLLCRVLPGEVERVEMNHGMFRGPSQGQISATHDSREMLQNNMGVIHVIKDEAQILPYCILHLTRRQHENAFQPPAPPPPYQIGSVVSSRGLYAPTGAHGPAGSNGPHVLMGSNGLAGPNGQAGLNGPVRLCGHTSGSMMLSNGPGLMGINIGPTTGPNGPTGQNGPVGTSGPAGPNRPFFQMMSSSISAFSQGSSLQHQQQQTNPTASSSTTQRNAILHGTSGSQGPPPTAVNAEEYEKRVLAMEKYLLPLQQEIKNNPSHTKLNKLLEIISKPKKRLVSMATLDKCEETLKKKFGW